MRARRSRGLPRKLRITRMGWWYITFTIFVGFAGINTGNNLIFMLFGLMLSGIVLSGVLSESTLRALTVERVLPADVTVGKPALVGIRITNHKRRTRTYAVAARDVTDRGIAGQSFALTIDGGQTKEISYRWEPKARGRVSFLRIDLVTRFPFGLFEKWRECDAPADGVVFPRDVPAPAIQLRRAVPVGERPSATAGPGTEFFALRDLRVGDDARAIHWLTSARRGRPVVVERERERRRRISIVLDSRAATLGATGTTIAPGELLDRLVESAAAVSRKAEREGCEVAFSAAGESVSPGAGPQHERRILRMLALLTPAQTDQAPIPATASDVVEIRLADALAARPIIEAA